MNKGGMCRDPFAGFARPDKLDPQSLLGPNDPPEKAIILATILDAFQSYVYFGIGDAAPDGTPRSNGVIAENFWNDYNYFFNVRSNQPRTWETHARIMDEIVIDEHGRRARHTVVLSNAQLQAMCFDRQFELLQWPFSMDTFLQMVRQHRITVLTKSGAQIRSYMRLLRECSVARCLPGESLPLFLDDADIDMRILLDPHSPEEVAALVTGFNPDHFKTKQTPVRFRPIYRPETVKAVFKLRQVYSGKGSLFEALPHVAYSPGYRDCRMSA